MATSFLIIHLLGAITTFFFIAYGIGAMLKNDTKDYSFYAKSIGFFGAYDIISGSLLTIASSNQSVLVFCSRIALYVGIIAAVEVALYMKMKGVSLFPKKALAYSTALSTFSVIATLFFLF